MAAGTKSDLKIYHSEFFAGAFERVAQMINVFNGASSNAIRLIQREAMGDYEKESFFKLNTSAVTRRDITSVSSVEDIKLSQDENISVKLSRKFGPIGQAIESMDRIGSDMRELSFILGQMYGEQKVEDMVNNAIRGAEAAIENEGNLNYDATGQSTKTVNPTHLANALAKMGDRAPRISAWIMHSKPYFDLVKNNISDKITNVADVVIYGGSPGTLGRPVIVTDSGPLHDAVSGGTDTYNTLGLVVGGVIVQESQSEHVQDEIVTGLENLVLRVQGEFTYNLGIKGFKWDTDNGAVNPTDTKIGTGSNWDKAVTSHKDCAGVHLKTQ